MRLAPLEARGARATPSVTMSGGTPTNPAPANRPSEKAPGKPSIFDDDLPELEAIVNPPPRRAAVPSPLDLEFPDELGNRQTTNRPSPPPRPGSRTTTPPASSPKSPASRSEATTGGSKLKSLLDSAEEELKEYRVLCRVCGTAQYVPKSAQGMKIKCPDCHSSFKAPPPQVKDRGPTKVLLSEEDVPLVATEYSQVQAETENQRVRTNAILDKAKRELSDDDIDNLYSGDFDTAGFIQRTLGFVFDPIAMAFVIGYGIVFGLVFALGQYGLMNANSGFGRGALLIGMIGAPLLGILFGMPMLSSGLALLESVANRQTRVTDWPGFNVFDHFGDLMALLAALLGSALPGVLFSVVVFGDGNGAGRMQLACSMVTVYLLFPVVLLSILDNGSLFQPVSPAVLSSFKPAAEAWGAYYLKTLLAFGGAMVAWFVLLSPENSPMVVGMGGFLVSPLVFFTFQQLGALADAISEHLSIAFASKEDVTDVKQADE